MVKRKTSHQATKDPRVIPLLALHDELGLTDFQRRFVEALAVDPQRNQTRAAVAAGAPRKGAAVAATRMLRLAKVQKYLNALTVTEREQRASATQAAVAGLTEVLTVLTAQMRASPGDFIVPVKSGGFIVDVESVRKAKGVIKEVAHDEAGDMRIRFVDPQGAAKALLAHYTDQPLVAGSGNVTVNTVINSLPQGKSRPRRAAAHDASVLT